MTKKEKIKFAQARGYSAHYSGKQRKFYFRKFKRMEINQLINKK